MSGDCAERAHSRSTGVPVPHRPLRSDKFANRLIPLLFSFGNPAQSAAGNLLGLFGEFPLNPVVGVEILGSGTWAAR
jgi:hypothetical protein